MMQSQTLQYTKQLLSLQNTIEQLESYALLRELTETDVGFFASMLAREAAEM